LFVPVEALIKLVVNEVTANEEYVNVPIVLIFPVVPSMLQTFAPVAVLKTPILFDVLKNKYFVPPATP